MPFSYGLSYGMFKGLIYGPGSGLPSGVLPPNPALAPYDGPQYWYVPAVAGDWAAIGVPAPTAWWAFTEGAGSIVDQSGGGLALAPVGTVGYSGSVASWSRVGCTVTQGAGNGFGRLVAEAPNPATTSQLWLGYVDLTSGAGAAREIICGSDAAGATELTARTSAGDLAQVKCLATATTGTNNLHSGMVRLVCLKYDRTNGTVATYTDAEKVVGTYGAGVLDGNKGFRAGVQPAPGMTIMYGALWTGADAELTDAQVKTRLQAMNIVIPWT